MGKNSTLFYFFSNFEKSELLTEDLYSSEMKEFKAIFDFIEENTKKIPGSIVDNIINFANDCN